ncbi:asparagine synthase-related protein [Natronosalvus caseinilyticus]|uniref:asparagine synthase-related protein n=1 Tax=Natronosalvus caseinilyticus TaxID=2953747 RepID=UPI0028ACC0EB|nr:asparagine synthase-related protein [Natronosalvus caseinilyticus]
MPGITAVETPPATDVLDEMLDTVCFTDDYVREDFLLADELVVAATGYEQYPVDVFETDDCTIVLEGHLYGTDDVEAAVTEAASYVREDQTEQLSSWLAERDAEFLLVVADRETGSLWILNDAFGRLPTYRATIGDTTLVTRELKAVRKLARTLEDGLEPNRLALGQQLLFGYPLGTRSLYEDVEHLPPGSLLEVETGEITSLHEFRFDSHANADRSVRANALRLRDRFVEACENRASVGEETVISLSGGLDSRAVIAGYNRVDCQLYAATSARADGGNTAEVDVARQVADALDVPWSSYIADRTEHHQSFLLETTQGMNNLGMSIGLDFAEQVAERHENAVFVTGDGGDKAIPDLTPAREVDTTDDLVEALLDGQQLFSPEEVADIVNVTAEDLVDSVRERVASYPETTLEAKHVHFLVRERGVNWLNHGEDRTRHYLWSTTPFYALPFFEEAMACPPEQKQGNELYREFLSGLSPAVVGIDYVDFGAPIDSLEFRIKQYGYNWLTNHPELKSRVTSLLKRNGNGADERPVHALSEAVRTSTDLDRYFSEEAINRIAWSGGAHTSQHRYVLYTAIAALTNDELEAA